MRVPIVDELERPFSELERYAGWLGKDHVSVAVRANVQALRAAMAVGTATSPLLIILTKDIGRLQGGDLRKMLQKAAEQVRTVLASSAMELHERDAS